ncbi:hypothetical protein CW304_16960 [Bacillus sp. UFRGS-B20]|nr:hypothetical protein CW304_16960 [Bacillus sp. UFRGS-B20]
MFFVFHGTHFKAPVSDKKITAPFPYFGKVPDTLCLLCIRIFPFRIDYYQWKCLDVLRMLGIRLIFWTKAFHNFEGKGVCFILFFFWVRRNT